MLRSLVLLLLLLSSILFAKQYDTRIMTIEAKLFPKIALLEQHIKNNPSKILSIVILANEIDLNAAENFKTKIISNYPDPISNKQIVVNILKLEQLKDNPPDAIIVLSHEEKKLKEIASWANKNKIVSFVYDPSYFKYGYLASIYVGKTTKPNLNKKTILEYNFIFDPYLLQLSKIDGE